MKRVLVTGATGFVGQALCADLAQHGYRVRAALRTDGATPAGSGEAAVVGDINRDTDWSTSLQGVDVVCHLAALAHVMDRSAVSDARYFETNEQGTLSLVAAAAAAGVKRFVFLSSIKVNGEETPGKPYDPQDEPRPSGAYGRSKWLAEQHIAKVARETGIEAVIVRPPLVYGPGVRANFLRLLQLVEREWPLPLGAIRNARSLVSLWNLTSLLRHVIEHSRAPGHTWMVSDGNDLSTPELIRLIASSMGRRANLLPVPAVFLSLAGSLAGRRAVVARLCGSLAVDISATRAQLGWTPPLSVGDGVGRTVRWYLSRPQS